MAKSARVRSAAPKSRVADAPFAAGKPAKAPARKPVKADDGDAEGGAPVGRGSGKQLVIVESPAKAKTINKYLGSDYTVMASVGHIRDLPSKNPKGVKAPVPGVDLEHDFAPSYEILDKKGKVISDLKRSARTAREIWFATDPDREGEAIAWHLAEELGVKPESAKRVMFSAITKTEIQRAFGNPHPINMDRVNAQQARRILDRIVGYQVSPLLWKKVARGLSAGRVQSVAVRIIVEREREIRAFIPDEYWEISASFTAELAKAAGFVRSWQEQLGKRDEKGKEPTQKDLAAWLNSVGGIRAELVEVGGEKFELLLNGANVDRADPGAALAARAEKIAAAAGLKDLKLGMREDAEGKGPARWVRTLGGTVDPATPYRVTGIETKQTSSRPPPPFITSTLQQAGSSRLGFNARRTMQTAQGLYEGVDIPGEGPVGLITYMRTDSTHISGEALSMVREYVGKTFGDKYLPEKPNFFTSSNKDAQEAHEAIRPTSLAYPPSKVRSALKPDQFRLYQIIWDRFVACQMTPAQWDATAVTISGGTDAKLPVSFRATGRVLVFDGFLKVAGVPASVDEQTLPPLKEQQPLAPFSIEPKQKFTAPPARFSEAGLIKTLEAEGIGRPSTYAAIIGVIQDRKYVELLERRFYATDLGEVVTDMLMKAFPQIMDVGYTRELEGELDKVEDDHLDWVKMLHKFYKPFSELLAHAGENLEHAKAEVKPAPKEYTCPKCAARRAEQKLAPAGMVYRLGKSGRFLSCATYPECDYACPCDRNGKPQPIEATNVACPKCKSPMSKRTGRFGAFLGCTRYGDKQNPCDGILNLDKLGKAVAPSMPPLVTALPCPKCEAPMNLRPGKFGPWLGCSKFPKCRGRGNYKGLSEPETNALGTQLTAWVADHPIPIIRLLDGTALTDAKGKPLPDAPRADGQGSGETLEAVADELGV